MVENSKENIEKCLCPECYSHNQCMKERALIFFCSRGKCDCEINRHGCLCNQCPVAVKHDLHGSYYCNKDNKQDE
jgi:hypothetical protein